MDDVLFSSLLQNKLDQGVKTEIPAKIDPSNHLRAKKSANLDDLIEMIAKLVSKTMKETNTQFIPDEGGRILADTTKTLNNPYIFYKVIERTPKGELKPRERELITETSADEKTNRQGRIFGQKFKCLLQFNIVASEYSTANKVMTDFEDLMLNYTYYFKRNGVAELLFHKHFTDKDLDIFRQTISVRSLQYYCEVEKLTAVFESDIENIFT